MSIEWKRKDADLPQSSNVTQLSLPNVTTSTLAIQNVTEGDEGIYFCICWIGKQSSKSNTAILYYGMMQFVFAYTMNVDATFSREPLNLFVKPSHFSGPNISIIFLYLLGLRNLITYHVNIIKDICLGKFCKIGPYMYVYIHLVLAHLAI